MSAVSDSPERTLLREFRRAIKAAEELYRTSAQEYVHAHAEQMGQKTEEFVARMVDLHRGLLLKIFVEIGFHDLRWRPAELRLAEELFQHVWGQSLDEEQLQKALAFVVEQRDSLRWGVLVGPFERLRSLNTHIPELQTVVMRIANLVAKCDGTICPAEVRQVQWIQSELQRHLERIPLTEPAEETPIVAANQVLKPMPAETPPLPAPLKPPSEGKVQHKSSDERLADALAELDKLIGLVNIKQEVHALVNYLKMQRERERHGLPTTPLSLHATFSGNPGTGKTTVARLLGNIFGAMGILAKGHLVETDRSGLVAEYAGQTGPKTHKCIDNALDGVLFIDEAYSLVAEAGDDPYGAEAVQTLLKRMEDDRHRLVVVLAGYPAPMQRLLESNPGLSSRFQRHFHFPDYSAPELGHILETMCEKNQYELHSAVRGKLLVGFQYLLDHRDEHFGNGRLVRNIFERCISRLANRIAGIAPITRELLTTFDPSDVLMEEVPVEYWQRLEKESLRFLVSCPGCLQSSPLPQQYLGQKVRCKPCGQRFDADWGVPLPGASSG